MPDTQYIGLLEVARAMWETRGQRSWDDVMSDWARENPIDYTQTIIEAQAAITAHTQALTEAGYVIAPREPTLEMLCAGQSEIRIEDSPNTAGPHTYASREEVAEAWRAMIEAIK